MQEQVCITIPTYKQFGELNKYEVISWQQCLRILGRHPICLVCPPAIDPAPYIADAALQGATCRHEYFAAAYFAGIDGYNRLMLSRQLYRRFERYEYMLVYQLDVFVFRDEIAQWCAQGYSYVGAPWFEGYHPTPEHTKLWQVGNGGFTLRRIPDALRALHTLALAQDWATVVREHFRAGRLRGYTQLPTLLKALLLGNNTHWALNDFERHRQWHQEDYFWGVICNSRFPWFKVPTPEQALAFGFEVQPAIMYELNQRRLPMGCHAWEKYGTDFWKPLIEQYGYHLT